MKAATTLMQQLFTRRRIMVMNKEKIIDKLEELGWYVSTWEDSYVEIETSSPAGEDLIVDFNPNQIWRDLEENSDSFDREEHVLMWLRQREEGVSGIPDLDALYEDAKDIEQMYKALADAFYDCERM